MLKGYSKFLDLIEKVEKLILAVTVPAMVGVMMYQVILRYVFSAGNPWSEELTRYLFIFNVMIAAAIAVRRNSHLQIDIILNLLSKRVQDIITIIATIAGIAFMALLFKDSITLCQQAAKNISPGTGLSMAIPYACMPIGLVLMILTSIEVIFGRLEALRNKEG